jgi:phospholipid/cholesterol/gamma-HCH transport system substrate-binding protein
VKRAIREHKIDFIAITALLAGALAVAIFVLEHQPAFTFGKSFYTVKAEFQTGAAVTAGQGQAVTIAGVQVGLVGAVKLDNGRAVVTMNIYPKYKPIYQNATVLLRPRTPLKDMYLSLDPGSPSASAIPSGGTLPVAATSPDIDFSQILSSLDSDTRNYLLLLLSGGAQAFHDHGATGSQPSEAAVSDLRGTFKRFAPLGRDTVAFTRLLTQRRANIQRSIHNLNLVANALGDVETQFASLIDSSNTNFSAIASEDANLEQALTLLPPTLQTTSNTLVKVRAFANASTPTLKALLPFAHNLGPALAASRPLFRDTTPVIKNQLRPFAVAVQPLAATLKPAATQLAKATPPLVRSFGVLNSLFNELGYKPPGSQQSYLFWGTWLSHIVDSLGSKQDAQGPLVQGSFMATCGVLQLIEVTFAVSDPPIAHRLPLLNAPDWSKIKSPFCPTAAVP